MNSMDVMTQTNLVIERINQRFAIAGIMMALMIMSLI